MKPHEETWELLQSTVVAKGTGEVAFRHMDRLVLAVAAPEMARALLAMLDAHSEGCTCSACEAATHALAKAGVPLP